MKEGDIIETDEHTRKNIDYEVEDPNGNGALKQFDLFLDAQSQIDILTANNNQCTIEQFKGKLRMKTKDLSLDELELKTPQAICGVRGTDYEINIDNDSTTILTVFEGEVEFSNRNGSGTVTVGANEQSTIRAGEPPTEPETIDERPSISRWWETSNK